VSPSQDKSFDIENASGSKFIIDVIADVLNVLLTSLSERDGEPTFSVDALADEDISLLLVTSEKPLDAAIFC